MSWFYGNLLFRLEIAFHPRGGKINSFWGRKELQECILEEFPALLFRLGLTQLIIQLNASILSWRSVLFQGASTI